MLFSLGNIWKSKRSDCSNSCTRHTHIINKDHHRMMHWDDTTKNHKFQAHKSLKKLGCLVYIAKTHQYSRCSEITASTLLHDICNISCNCLSYILNSSFVTLMVFIIALLMYVEGHPALGFFFQKVFLPSETACAAKILLPRAVSFLWKPIVAYQAYLFWFFPDRRKII